MAAENGNQNLPIDDSSFPTKIREFTYDPNPSFSSTAMPRRSKRAQPGQKDEDIPAAETMKLTTSQQPLIKNNSPSASMKRLNPDQEDSQSRPTKVAKTTKKKVSAPIENNLKDSLRPGLKLIMVGVNPGETTARTGQAYAHKSNRYWPTMFQSGVTSIQHLPLDTPQLMDLYGIGHTNIVARATRTEAEIQEHEWPEGAAILDEKIALYKPEGVAIVGKGIWKKWIEYKIGRKFSDKKDNFQYGWQSEEMQLGRQVDEDGTVIWPGAKTIVVATTSGAAAQFAANKGEMRLKLWKPLGDWYRPIREEWVANRKDSAKD